jgi:hypothetical protein
VLVYPFDAPSDLDPKVGLGIAQIFSQIFVGSQNLTVLAIGQGVKRQDYQKNALAKHADYYVAGYVQPIGQAAAVVSQLVNVQSGTSAFSQTAQITSLQDIASQALTFDSIIQQLEQRDQPNIANQGKATPAPQPTNGAAMKLSGITGAVQSLFKGKGKSGSATPQPAIVKPARSVIVVRLSGTAPSGDVTRGTDDLLASMNRRFNARSSNLVPADVSKSADSICGSKRDNTVASGTLNVHREGSGFRGHNVYDFTLNVFACFGAKLYTTTATNPDMAKAIDTAVSSYAKDHPENS